MALLSGLLVTFYPTYIQTNTSIECTITSLLHHSMCWYMALLLFVTGYVKPELTLKKWASAPLTYCVLITYGLFCIKIFGVSDSMQINSPILSGTFLNWFYIGLIFLAVYTIFLFVWDAVTKKKESFFCQKYLALKGSIEARREKTKKSDNI